MFNRDRRKRSPCPWWHVVTVGIWIRFIPPPTDMFQ
jgi:hypothetical protein